MDALPYVFVIVWVLLLSGCGKKEMVDGEPDRPVQRDDTDPPGARSGLLIYTDAKTGCQYLRAKADGGITPRMGADGKQLCDK